MVTARDDEETNDLFDTVNDEVTAHLLGFFVASDQFNRIEMLKVASIGFDHDRKKPQVAGLGCYWTVIHAPRKASLYFPAVSGLTFSAL